MESRRPFLFPQAQSTVLPDPAPLFSQKLLSSPLPTNSFFQNLVLNRSDEAEYIHPYLIKCSLSSLSICYPSQFSNPASVYQIFNEDLTISASNNPNPNATHLISSFDDLSVTLEFPSSKLKFYLVRGSPYLTADATGGVTLLISTIYAILEFTPDHISRKKYTIKLNNGQTWLLYASRPIHLTQSKSFITSTTPYSGVIRIANLPVQDSDYEYILDRCSPRYPTSGKAVFTGPFSLEYKWDNYGWEGDLLMLATPLHLQLLVSDGCPVNVLNEFKYKSMDGELVGITGDSWKLRTDPISVTWHSIRGVNGDAFPQIIAALVKDVEALDPSTIRTTSSYFYGKLIARAARLALIAEEVDYPGVLPAIKKFLKATVGPWLDGKFGPNGFLYDRKWGGLVTKKGSTDPAADSGFGMYNGHHHHLGHFLYAIAVLTKLDPAWGRHYKPQAYSLVSDIMTLEEILPNLNYPHLRNFDLWKLHSWAGGLTAFADGRNQESSSEAVNAYYSAALLGLAHGDVHLMWVGSMLSALEIRSAQMWWHIREEDKLYTEEFTRENRIMGILWNNKRDSELWLIPAEWREFRLAVQLMPITPISEILFSDPKYAKQLVTWTEPALSREGVEEEWVGFAFAMKGIYDQESALRKIKGLKRFENGNSLSNLLWWIHSRTWEGEKQPSLRWESIHIE